MMYADDKMSSYSHAKFLRSLHSSLVLLWSAAYCRPLSDSVDLIDIVVQRGSHLSHPMQQT